MRIALIAALMLCVAGCGDEPAKPKSDGGGGYLGELSRGHRRAREMASLGGARQCIQAFHALKGRYPKDLKELEAERLAVPPPPKGMKYKYTPETGHLELEPAE
jgi:hypothetical protein